MKSTRQFAIFLMLLPIDGCANPAPPISLDQYLANETIICEHNEYFVDATLVQGANPQRVIHDLRAYLSGDPKVRFHDPNDKQLNMEPPLRDRDYGALVLAQLEGYQISMMIDDDIPSREKIIQSILAHRRQ